MIALDRRGRGDSGDRDGYALEREFDDVAAVMRDAGEGTFLFGHSYGGLVAAGAAPLVDRLSRLLLYEPAMGGALAEPADIDRWAQLIEAGDRDRMVREFLHDIGGYSQQEIDALRAMPSWQRRLEVAPTVPRELRAERAFRLDGESLRALGVPALLLLGSESPDWARRSTERYAGALLDAEVRTLDGHGHGAAVSGPELLASEIRRFLAQPG